MVNYRFLFYIILCMNMNPCKIYFSGLMLSSSQLRIRSFLSFRIIVIQDQSTISSRGGKWKYRFMPFPKLLVGKWMQQIASKLLFYLWYLLQKCVKNSDWMRESRVRISWLNNNCNTSGSKNSNREVLRSVDSPLNCCFFLGHLDLVW